MMDMQSMMTSVASIDTAITALNVTRKKLVDSLEAMKPKDGPQEDPKWFKNPRRHLSDFGKAHLRDLHAQGMTIVEAATAMNISRSRVTAWWTQWGLIQQDTSEADVGAH